MKKIVKNLIISLTIGASSLIAVYVVKTISIQKKQPEISEKKLIADITGAVDNPGNYLFYKDQTIREIIFKAKVKNSADINLLILDLKPIESFEIFIPYKVGEMPKLKYSEIKTINQLKAMSIKNNIAKLIIKYKNENKEVPTWKKIDELAGVGPKTLAYLKKYIDLS